MSEIRSTTRRIYLTALFGVGGLSALIAMLTLVVGVLEDVIDGAFGQASIYDVRIPIAIVLTFGAVASYHWAIWREDRADAPDEDEVTITVRMVVLVSEDGTDAARRLADETGVRVRVWDQPDGAPAPSHDALTTAVADAEHPRLLLIARPDGLDAIPYTER